MAADVMKAFDDNGYIKIYNFIMLRHLFMSG